MLLIEFYTGVLVWPFCGNLLPGVETGFTVRDVPAGWQFRLFWEAALFYRLGGGYIGTVRRTLF